MNIELVTIGTELLLGMTLDSNGAEISRALAAQGMRVTRRTSVADRGDDIRDAVADALRRTGAVLTTGGLGPTSDDITKKVVADLFGAPLEFDETIWAGLLARFARLERKPSESNRSQAEVPRGAIVLTNRWGTAPGLWLEGPPGLVIMLACRSRCGDSWSTRWSRGWLPVAVAQ
jgi:nicotinamide-nucleotide amidase